MTISSQSAALHYKRENKQSTERKENADQCLQRTAWKQDQINTAVHEDFTTFGLCSGSPNWIQHPQASWEQHNATPGTLPVSFTQGAQVRSFEVLGPSLRKRKRLCIKRCCLLCPHGPFTWQQQQHKQKYGKMDWGYYLG